MPIFLLLGIGGLPCDPDLLLMEPLGSKLTLGTLSKSHVSPERLLEYILNSFSKHKRMKDKPTNHGAPWYDEDDQRLVGLYKSGASIPDLMAIFGRSHSGITSRLRKLGLTNQ